MKKENFTGIIARCLNGDAAAQEELVLAVQDRVYYHCRKMLKDEDRAFDLTQDVLMTMLTKLETLQNPEVFTSWLGGITANLCRNAINRGPREMQIPEDEEGNSLLDTYETLDEQSVPDKVLDNDETRRMIAELVDDLPDAQRQCVLLYYYNEMSVKDIAAALEVSENTIKSRLNYARKAIKEGVERYEKQGVKLYGLSPLPFLLFFLGRDAKACCMTGEQAATLAKQVVQGAGAGAAAAAVGTTAGSGAGTAGAGVATGSVKTAAVASAKAATAAAGKGVLGLSAKAIAGAVAGLVLVGGIAGSVLLSDRAEEKEDNDPKWDLEDRDEQEMNTGENNDLPPGHYSLEYVALPEWTDLPYDELGEYFFARYISETFDAETDAGIERYCTYTDASVDSEPGDVPYNVITRSMPDSDHVAGATFYFNHAGEVAVGWRGISEGDSFRTVLDKLGFGEIPNDANYVSATCYEDAPQDSMYFTLNNEQLGEGKQIWLSYVLKGHEQEINAEIFCHFENDLIHQLQVTVQPRTLDVVIEEEQEAVNGDEGIPIQFIALPAWLDEPFDRIETLMYPETKVFSSETTSADGDPVLIAMYTYKDSEKIYSYLTVEASPETSKITQADLSSTYGQAFTIGWRDIFLGDSFETVLDKLELGNTPHAVSDESMHMNVTCTYYTDAPHNSVGHYTLDSSSTTQYIKLQYGLSDHTEDFEHTILLGFHDNKLAWLLYNPFFLQEENQSNNQQGSSDLNTEEDPSDAANAGILWEGEGICLMGEGTFVERKLDTCGEDWLPGIFWEDTIDEYISVVPNAGLTVTNAGTDENAYIHVWCSEYTKSDESRIISTLSDDTMESIEVELLGRYFDEGHGWYLTEEITGRSAGGELYWGQDINGVTLDDSNNEVIRLYSGDSVTFQLPQNEEDSLYLLSVAYVDPDKDSWATSCVDFYITSDEN